MISVDIKNKIKAHLDALVAAHTIKEVIMDDFKVSPIFDRDIMAYPAAILTGPAIEGAFSTPYDNIRTHSFAIVVIEKRENIEGDPTAVETLIESILDRFDNDPTLGGSANAGLEPASTVPEPVTIRDKSYIYFTVVLKAKAIKSLS